MAETITIQVSVNDTKALASLNNLQALVDKLNKTAVNIPASAGGGTGNGTGGSGGTGSNGGRAGSAQQAAIQVKNLANSYDVLSRSVTQTANGVTAVNKAANGLDVTLKDTYKNGTLVSQTITTNFKATDKAIERATNLSTKLGTSIGKTLSKITENEHLYPTGTFDQIKAGLTQAQESLKAADNAFAQTKDVEAYGQALNGVGKNVADLNNQFQNLLPNQSKLTKLLGDSLDNIIAKIAAWQIINAAVAVTIRSFKEAVATIKEVDSELATIRKVTGMTANEAAALGDSSFAVASKYGVSANEYLQSISTFARAGYMDAAEGLGELAIKTQLVGDTTTDIANQFLLSTDAAWKYNGSIEALSRVLDEANIVDNKYATSIEKIAEGMPIVANVAAMAGMSAEETIAMIGTITAVTQETGTKAATAARALILNILGDTTTEIEDGVTATEESVKTLTEIVDKYSDGALSAARASGKLLNPLTAIRALAEADLSDADLYQIVQALGGKLRTNQLEALISNVDMLESMLADMGVSAGSADEEISVMLDTWESKTQILQNTWTQFISHLVDTGAVKGALDVITGLIKVLDNDLVKSIATIAMLTAGFSLLAKAVIAVAKSSFVAWLGTATSGAAGLSKAVAALNAKLLANPVIAIAAAAAVAIYGVVKAVDALTVSYEEQKQIVDEAATAVADHQSELDGLIAKEGELTAAQKARREELEKILQLEKDTLAFEQGQLYEKYQEEHKSPVYGEAWEYTTSIKQAKGAEWTYSTNLEYEKYKSQLVDLIKQYGAGKISEDKYKEGLLEVRSAMSETAKTLQDFKDSNVELLEIDEDFLDMYDNIVNLYSGYKDATNDAGDAALTFADIVKEQTDSFKAAADAVKGYEAALEGLKDFDANFDQMKSAFESAKEAMEVGEISSPEMIAFLQTVYSPEQMAKFGFSASEAWQNFNKSGLGAIFEAKDSETAFYNYIKSASRQGKISSDIISFDDKGMVQAVSSFKELADAIGVSEGLVTTFFEALNGRWDSFLMTQEDAEGYFTSLSKVLGADFLENITADSEQMQLFTEALRQLTGSQYGVELQNVTEGFFRAMGIDLTDDLYNQITSAIEAITADPPKVEIPAEIKPTVETNTEDTTESISEESKKLDEVNANVETLSQEVQTATTEITEALNGLKDAIGSYDGENLGTIIQSVSDVLTTAKGNSDVILQKLAKDALSDGDTLDIIITALGDTLTKAGKNAEAFKSAIKLAATGDVTALAGIITDLYGAISDADDGGAAILKKLGEDLTGSDSTVWQEIGNVLNELGTLSENAAAAGKLLDLAGAKDDADKKLFELIPDDVKKLTDIGLSADDANTLIGAKTSGKSQTIIDIINANKENLEKVDDATGLATKLIGAAGESETSGTSLLQYVNEIAGNLEALGYSTEVANKLLGELTGGDSASLATLIVTNKSMLQSTQKRMSLVSAFIGVLTGKTTAETLADAVVADQTAAQGILGKIQSIIDGIGTYSGTPLGGLMQLLYAMLKSLLEKGERLDKNFRAATELIGSAEATQNAGKSLLSLISENADKLKDIGLSEETVDALNKALENSDVEAIVDIINANKENLEKVDDATGFAKDLIGAAEASETAGETLIDCINKNVDLLKSVGIDITNLDALIGEGDGTSLATLILDNQGKLNSVRNKVGLLLTIIGVIALGTTTDTLADAITADKTAAQGVLDLIQSIINGIGNYSGTPLGSLMAQAGSMLQNLAAKIAEVASNIGAWAKELLGSGSDGEVDAVTGADASATHAASGTDYARGGATLVNDGKPVNGSPAELIVDSHGAYIANSGNPAMVNLERGAKVYTAEETAEILRGDKRKYVQAFGRGSLTPTPYSKSSSSTSGGSSARASSSSSSSAKTVGEQLAEKVNDLLSNLEKQITLAENRNDTVLAQALREEAIELVKTYVDKMLTAGLKLNDNEVLDLINKGYGYSSELMNELVDALEELTNATDKASALEEKRQAVEDAQKSLENIRNQRKVRILNPVTGQWEWVANADDITAAEKELADAQKALQEEQVSQELEALKKAGIGDIENLTLGEGILSLINSASTEEQQKIADILNAITGGAENSVDKNGTSLFKSTDSHDTVYQFGEITLTDEQASTMTVKQLAGMIRELEVT